VNKGYRYAINKACSKIKSRRFTGISINPIDMPKTVHKGGMSQLAAGSF
jgi:hypothetical protein